MTPRKVAQRSPAARMSPPASAAPQTSTDEDQATWQAAHDKVEAAFDNANAALAHTHDKAQRRLLFDTADALSDELTRLNQQDMQSRTIALAAASAALDPGIERLTALKAQLDSIAQDLATASEVIGAVDGAIGGIKSFLAIL